MMPDLPLDEIEFEDSLGPISRISNAAEASASNWPFIVQIYRKKKSDAEHCNSAILNPTILMTAAHCLYESVRGGVGQSRDC